MKFNVQTMKKALISGYNNLYNFYPEINKLNVFPVPDGDTGTNMYLTMSYAIKEINNIKSNSIEKIIDIFSRGLIMGARGNSGVILSQIFRGFAVGLKNVDVITTKVIKNAFLLSKEMAYKGVMKPTEGTILTIIREISENLSIVNNNISILETFSKIVSFANIALNNTPELLPILKKTNIVDSGGFGLVKILEGLLVFFETGKIIKKQKNIIQTKPNNHILNIFNKNTKFGYCTEAIIILNSVFIEKKIIKINYLFNYLNKLKNTSIIIVIDKDILKIHVHTLTPGIVLNYLQKYGEFKNIRIENMKLQNEKHIRTIKYNRILQNKEAIIAVTPSNGIAQFFKKKLNVNAIINCDNIMNPSIDDFLQAIEYVDAEKVYILPNNNNVIPIAKKAAKLEKKSNIFVINTNSIQEGVFAILTLKLLENNKKKLSILKKKLKFVKSIAISVAKKNTFYNGTEIFKNDYIGLINNQIIMVNAKLELVIKNIFDNIIKKNKSEIIIIFIGLKATVKENNIIKMYLDNNLDIEYEIIYGNQLSYPYLIAIK